MTLKGGGRARPQAEPEEEGDAEAVGQTRVELAREACRGFPLVIMNWSLNNIASLTMLTRNRYS